jgi:hypothetical protein
VDLGRGRRGLYTHSPKPTSYHIAQLGRINLLTPELITSIKESEVKDGAVVSLKSILLYPELKTEPLIRT